MDDSFGPNPPSKQRAIDRSIKQTSEKMKSKFLLVPSIKIKTWKALIVVVFAAGFFAALVWSAYNSWYIKSDASGGETETASKTAPKLKNLIFWPAGVNADYKYTDINSKIRMNKVKNSPYDSFTLPLTEVRKAPKDSDIPDKAITDTVKSSGKLVWPRISFNMLLGCCEEPDAVKARAAAGKCKEKDANGDLLIHEDYKLLSPDTGYKCNEGGWYCTNSCQKEKSLADDAKTYFKDIKKNGYIGLWYEQKEGKRGYALKKFYDRVTEAAQIAKKTGAPGIVIDHEFYNNYQIASVEKIYAANPDKEPDNIKQRLKSIGGTIADKVNKVYSPKEAVLLMTSAKFNESNYEAVDYVIKGILGRAKDKEYPLKVVDGGENSLWYLHSGVGDSGDYDCKDAEGKWSTLKHKMDEQTDFSQNIFDFYKDYSKYYEPGGTQSLYLNWEKTGGAWKEWLQGAYDTDKKCLKAKMGSDLIPLFKYLFANREYVWTFGGSGSGPDGYQYNDFNDGGKPDYFKQYRNILQTALRGNGVCEKNRNETCENTPEDCVCPMQ